ncbi:immunity 21 family protein [Actinoplanes sp. KI2]|uniref:immunity 21 family protein n=1 Tax=Actinoplanes sp. KI2 TaxID=2983315 RepID=UPI0021D57E4D|nr:immunity 21 family protein [Actinoplanes sp. KI2]MCU7725226.1 immunity 21 family protein [Actinoplanes sp. KI2]
MGHDGERLAHTWVTLEVEMRWIKSLGGPLILLPRDAVRRWTGAYGPGGEEDWDEDDTEYWRISEEVTDFAEAVDVAGASALVLANGSSPTTFVEGERLFVQQLAKGSEPDVVGAVLRLLPSIAWQHATEWVCEGPSLLFDSARFGPEVGPGDGLAVDLTPGRYELRSAYRQPDATADVFVAVTMAVPLS